MSNCIILADQVYQDRTGKYIIAGTYSGWTKRISGWEQAVYDAPNGLSLYGRFTPERFGDLILDLRIKDQERQEWNESWLSTKIKVSIHPGDKLPPLIDFPLHTPAFTLRPTIRNPPENGIIRLTNMIELSYQGELLASTPFEVVFQLDEGPQKKKQESPQAEDDVSY